MSYDSDGRAMPTGRQAVQADFLFGRYCHPVPRGEEG